MESARRADAPGPSTSAPGRSNGAGRPPRGACRDKYGGPVVARILAGVRSVSEPGLVVSPAARRYQFTMARLFWLTVMAAFGAALLPGVSWAAAPPARATVPAA